MKDDGGPVMPPPIVYAPSITNTAPIKASGMNSVALQVGPPKTLIGDKGLSIRDWFAGQALAGLYAGRRSGEIPNSDLSRWFVEEAYGIADAMLAARKEAEGE